MYAWSSAAKSMPVRLPLLPTLSSQSTCILLSVPLPSLSSQHTILTPSPSVWDCKPDRKDDPIHWVELKTSAEIRNDRDMIKYERKLLKFWAQSFLLGVPKIIVGFRDQQGIVHRLEELETASIPGKVKKVGRGTWDGNICINFAAGFMDCKSYLPTRWAWDNGWRKLWCECGLWLMLFFLLFLQG